MASWERNSVRQPHYFFTRSCAFYTNPCALTPSGSCSITASLLRRQMDPTSITKNTVAKQAQLLNRATPHNKEYVLIFSPSWTSVILGKDGYPRLPRLKPKFLFATIVEYYPTSTLHFPWRLDILKGRSTTTRDPQDRARADEQDKIAWIARSGQFIDSVAFGEMVMNNKQT